MEQVGVRELRRHAGRYLARVEGGETLEVTDRGRPVALLVPVKGDRWDQLVASGRITPPDGDGDLLDERPVDYGDAASDRLTAMPDGER